MLYFDFLGGTGTDAFLNPFKLALAFDAAILLPFLNPILCIIIGFVPRLVIIIQAAAVIRRTLFGRQPCIIAHLGDVPPAVTGKIATLPKGSYSKWAASMAVPLRLLLMYSLTLPFPS